jgi:hypothetical protein
MDLPWYAWIGILAVFGWIVTVVIGSINYGRAKGGTAQIAEVMEQNIATNAAVLAKLETIETRLGAVEKTLTDIP